VQVDLFSLLDRMRYVESVSGKRDGLHDHVLDV
jgi:hypothetical protein